MSSPDPKAHDRSDRDYGTKPNISREIKTKVMKGKHGLQKKGALSAFHKAIRSKLGQ